jgi:periplasmic protein TonB
MSALVQRGSVQGRPVALAITIALHMALVAGLLAMKVAQVAAERATEPIGVNWIEEKRPPIPPENHPRPRLREVGTVVTPDIPLTLIPMEDSITLPPDPGPVAQAEPEFTPASVTLAVPDTPLRYQAVRPSDDYYPPHAIRMEAEGAAIVRACVDAAGQLSGRPTVVRTSRESLLDGAAVRWASEALRFQPATRAGVAIASCKEFRVSFNLH